MKCGATPITRPRARSIPTCCACGKNWKRIPPIQYISVLSTERATSSSAKRSGKEIGDGAGAGAVAGAVADQVPDRHAADFGGINCGLPADCAAHGGKPGTARPQQRPGQLRRDLPQCPEGARGGPGAFRDRKS